MLNRITKSNDVWCLQNEKFSLCHFRQASPCHNRLQSFLRHQGCLLYYSRKNKLSSRFLHIIIYKEALRDVRVPGKTKSIIDLSATLECIQLT